jgi:hypothetical protein
MCASLLLGEFYLTCQVKTLRREVARLEEERASLEFQIERATHEAKAYETARTELLKYPLKAFKDEASFYSSIKSAVKKSNVTISDIRLVEGDEGVASVQVYFRGNYASIVKAMSGWHQVDGVVRLSSLALLPEGKDAVSGVVVLESIIGNAGHGYEK